MKKIARSLVLALTIIPLVSVAGSGTAQSATQSAAMSCDWSYHWEFSKIRGVHKKAPGNTFKDGPGGTMTVRVERASTVQHSVSATVGAEAGPPFAKVRGEISAGAVKSKSVTRGHEYTHKVPAGKYGHLAYGSWSKRFNYRKIGMAPYCPKVVHARGTATYPTNSVGWKFHSTRH